MGYPDIWQGCECVRFTSVCYSKLDKIGSRLNPCKCYAIPDVFFSLPLKLEFGKLARFADGSCVASMGSTSVLVTAVSRSTSCSASSQGNYQLNLNS